jgi:hypothetical protein
MLTQALNRILAPLRYSGPLTLVSRSVAIFGYVDLFLGLLILIAPRFTATIFFLPPLAPLDISLLRVVGVLVAMLGVLYIINGRCNGLGFAVGSLLDRPMVPFIMATLWFMHILPATLAVAFSIVDFSGFLATAYAWRADLLAGRSVGGPALVGQSRTARSAEVFGWLILAIGFVTLLLPVFTASLLQLQNGGFPLSLNYLHLVGLLIGGLGMLFVVGASLESEGFIASSIAVQLLASLLIGLAWMLGGVPCGLALTFIVICLAGAVATLWAASADEHYGGEGMRVPYFAQWVSMFFAFLSGVVRNSRVFHPDGRVFLGTVRRCPSDYSGDLSGFVLMRTGMGVMKRGMPAWLAAVIPDAPSIALRFFTAAAAENDSPAALHLSQIPLQFQPDHHFDLLATAGGDRLWKLIWNLATGGKKYGLHPFDYFANLYFADVPYRVGDSVVWIRLSYPAPTAPAGVDAASREQALTDACAAHALLHVEVQGIHSAADFAPVAEIQFETELEIDQEALHFSPFSGRGFSPYGFFTGLRACVYPASVQSRPHNRSQREQRKYHPIARLIRYWREVPAVPFVDKEEPQS